MGGQPVAGKLIVVKVNGTVLGDVTTSSDGSYGGTLYLPAVNDESTSYQVEFTFHGDNAQNLTGYAFLPNGARYAACTTIYFGGKPSTNTSVLSVDTHGTEVFASVEEMTLKKAQESGWFSIWHEFSWWYPWY